MAIKEMLREELDNSRRMERDYNAAIAKLPKGSLIKKRIRGHEYYYLVFRENGKVRFAYKGKLNKKEIRKHQEDKAYRNKYRLLLVEIHKQIRFLERVLRAKQAV